MREAGGSENIFLPRRPILLTRFHLSVPDAFVAIEKRDFTNPVIYVRCAEFFWVP